MGVAKDIIIAVELGSSAIRAIASKKQPDGTLHILAVATEENCNCIRNGIIDNLDKTSLAISRVVKQIDNKLNIRTQKIYIGVSGQSLHTVYNPVMRNFDAKTLISSTMVDSLKEINQGIIYPDAQVLEVFPQEYNVGYRITSDPVGLQSNLLEARFANVVARSTLCENIEICVRNASLEIAEILISPICLADMLLDNNEKRQGCALVDIGADTTTIIIYTNNIMRQLVVIPLGGSDVTADITSKNIEYEEAETLKLKHGSATHEHEEEKQSVAIPISYNRNIDEDLLLDIIEARYEEILRNVWNRIEKYSEKLKSGITFIGGASKIANLKEAFIKYTNFNNHIRIAKSLPANITFSDDVQLNNIDSFCTIIALALNGEPICAGEQPAEPEMIQSKINFDEFANVDTTKAEDIPTRKDEPAKQTDQPATETEKQEEEKKEKEQIEKTPRKTVSFKDRCQKFWSKVSEMLSEPEED